MQKERGSSKTESKQVAPIITNFHFQSHSFHCSSIYTTLQRLLHPHPHTPRPAVFAPPLPLLLGLQCIAIQHPAQGPIIVVDRLDPGAPQRDGQVRAVHAQKRQPEVAIVRVFENGRNGVGACCRLLSENRRREVLWTDVHHLYT